MNPIVYADFSCADCYLASRRCDALVAAGVRVDVRAVEHRPELPITGLPVPVPDQDALTDRFATLQDLLLPGEPLPWAMPRIVPKSEAAVAALAAVDGTPVADDVRRLLFDAYWRDGADIGSVTVLRSLLAGPVLRAGAVADPLRQSGYAVTVDRAPVTVEAYRRIRDWRAQWRDLGSPALPVLLTEGAVLHGLDALRRLGKQVIVLGAEVAPGLNDPRRYPAERVRPPAAWVSQIGGRWRNSYRTEQVSIR